MKIYYYALKLIKLKYRNISSKIEKLVLILTIKIIEKRLSLLSIFNNYKTHAHDYLFFIENYLSKMHMTALLNIMHLETMINKS